MICDICDNLGMNKEYKIREMVIGLREEFLYTECSNCGGIQISVIPENLEKFYFLRFICFFRRREEHTRPT